MKTKYARVKETDFGHELSETVTGGYLQRGQYAEHEIITKWDKNLELIAMIIDGYDCSNLSDPDDFNYHRAKRAKTRHLKDLKVYLGLDEYKEKEKKKHKIIWMSRYYNFDDKVCIDSFVETDKMFGPYNKSRMRFTEATDENVRIAEEYEKRRQEFEAYAKEVSLKLFGR